MSEATVPQDVPAAGRPPVSTARPRGIRGERAAEATDVRVTAVLEVLAGRSAADVAQRWSLDVALLHRWVRGFVAAGTARVTNQPQVDEARQRDRFLATFAHELRSPLAVASGWVDLMLEGDLEPELAATSVRRLRDALTDLAERTHDVELLAAASLGRIRVAPEPVPVRMLAAQLPGEHRLDPAHERLTLEVDPRHFARVLLDLWRAASSHPVPRSMRLEVEVTGPWVELRVVREADPVPTRVLQALFEPFDLNDDATGVTTGLYLARALTVAHGGTIGVEQDQRRGVLWVRVPVHSPLTGASHLSHDPTDPGGPSRGSSTT